ncbi:hypothetical protein Tco_1139170 [Tanacetum coccineum]
MTTFLKNQTNWKAKQFTRYSFEEIEQIFNTVYKEVHTFVPIGTEVESERTKRAGQNLQQESSKKQKTGKASESAEEQKDKEADELSQEELQQMMIIVPEQGMNVEALQTEEGLSEAWIWLKRSSIQQNQTNDKERRNGLKLKRLFEPDNNYTL